MKTPTPVATPLPPRNFNQTGKQWPMMAATEEAAIHRRYPPQSTATPNRTAAIPLPRIQEEGGYEANDAEIAHHVGGARAAAAGAADVNPSLPADNEVSKRN